jgi:hypothetical protein
VDIVPKRFFRGSVRSRQTPSQLFRQREKAFMEIPHPLEIDFSQGQETVKNAWFTTKRRPHGPLFLNHFARMRMEYH